MPEKDTSIFKPKNLEKSAPKEAEQKRPEDFQPAEDHRNRLAEKIHNKETAEIEARKESIKNVIAAEDARAQAVAGDKRIFYSKRQGLKLIIEPKSKQWDKEQKRNILNKGKHIKFEDGVFMTSDPAEIKLLEEYAARKPREVFFQNPKAEKLLKALAMVEADEKAQAGKQGAASGG